MSEFSPIAIVGAGALFPGSIDVAGFWRNILAGRDLLSDVPETHWRLDDYYDPDPKAMDKTYARRGGFLPKVAFDPMGFGIPPSLLDVTDTSQLLALIVAQQVLDDAARTRPTGIDRSRMSVILGVTGGQELMGSMASRLQRPVWENALRQCGFPEDEVQKACERISAHYVNWTEATFPGLLGNVVAGRIANRLDLGGTNCTTDAACASALTSVHLGVLELQSGHSDFVITGGVDTMNDIFMYMCFSKTPALSPTGDCRPFDATADGTMLGEGIGMLALRRLADAERDGDPIYAVIRGMGSSSDGRSKSVYAPVSEGQAKALRRCYEAAHYGPETVELVEAHGTGTKAGDAAEINGLKTVFEESGRQDRQWCAIGSVKSQIGHTKSTAGAAGMLKMCLALHHRVLPPTIKVTRPNPQANFPASPFYVNTQARPWIRPSTHPRRASVSSFGFGGSNFHVTLEEYRGAGNRPQRLEAWPAELLCFSGDNNDDLLQQLEAAKGQDPALLARRLAAQSPSKRLRLGILVKEDLEKKLEAARKAVLGGPAMPGVFWSPDAEQGKLAFLFPGQGSQSVNMGADLAMRRPEVREILDRAEDVLPGLRERIFPRPAFTEEETQSQTAALTRTENAQPALGAISAGVLALLARLGLRPDATAGHSFGELVALYAAGAMNLETLIGAARERGLRMSEASGASGAMIAVNGSVERVRPHIGTDVVIANHNAPDQVVLAGPSAAIDAVKTALEAQGLRVTPLSVSTAFHSPLVAPAADGFSAYLRNCQFTAPQIPVWSNRSAEIIQTEDLPAWLGGHLAAPVRFVEQITAMYAAGVRTFVEVGPGATLTGLVGRILAGQSHQAIATDPKGAEGMEGLLMALGRLFALGFPVELDVLFADRFIPETKPLPKMVVWIDGSNYGKPYPPADGKKAPPNPPRPVAAPVVAAPPQKSVTETQKGSRAPTPATPYHGRRDGGAMENGSSGRTPGAGPVPAVNNTATSAWIGAFQEGQRSLADVQRSFSQSLTDGHMAYLRTVEESNRALLSVLSGQPLAAPAPAAVVARPVATPIAAPVARPALAAPAPAPRPVAAPVARPVAAAPAPVAAAPVAAPVVAPAPAPAARPAAAGPDLRGLLMAVVADKTGYPAEMLELGMSLEADLGIDSIKRVEILSALREKAPELPELDAATLGKLRTLGQILDALPGASAAPAPAAPAPVAAKAAAAPAKAGRDLRGLLMAVVADKTGYPAEMLELGMSLEADLGIDSIKRVEILSSLREKAPDLPELDAATLGKLRTLGQILDALPQGNAEGAPLNPKSAGEGFAALTRTILGRIPLSAGATQALPPVAVLADTLGYASALVLMLRSSGVDVQLVQDVSQLTGDRGVIYLRSLDDMDCCQDAFRAAKACKRGKGGLFVTLTRMGHFGLQGAAFPAAGGLGGLVKTLHIEEPETLTRAIDLDPSLRPEQAATLLLAELRQDGPTEVCIDGDGSRYGLLSIETPVPKDTALPGATDVFVVTGGARGVTAACLQALAQAQKPRIAILGRSAIDSAEHADVAAARDEAGIKRALFATTRGLGPAEIGKRAAAILGAREARASIAAIEAAGSKVLYLPVDVNSAEAVHKALATVRQQLGPITGLVHAAGVIQDRRIADKTDAQFEAVYATKVTGLHNLLAATQGDALRWIVFFSSVAGRTGNVGQCDYAMANEVLNRTAAAEAARRPGCVLRSIGWGPWEGGMVTPALKKAFEAQNVPLIPLDAGAWAFVAELGCSGPPEVVIGGGLPAAHPPAPEALKGGNQRQTLQSDGSPFLRDHTVDSDPVLPVVMAVEWLVQAGEALNPGWKVAAVEGLAVLKGIVLRHYHNGGDGFTITLSVLGANRLKAEIRGVDNTLHYRAELQMAAQLPAAPAVPHVGPLQPWPRPLNSLYGETLFHGPDFQVIRQLSLAGEQGLSADLLDTPGIGWPGRFLTDPAALDGAMQLGVIWNRHRTGGASLPMAVQAFRRFAAPAGPYRCILQERKSAGPRTVVDLSLIGQDGRVCMTLEGAENFALPGGMWPKRTAT